MLGWPLLFLIIVPTTFARCVDKFYRDPDCVQRCQSKMGYPGMAMGSTRWGTVLVQSDPAQWTALLTQACGLSGASSGAKVANAPGADPASIIPSTSATSSSAVSISSTASISSQSQSISATVSSQSKLPAATTSAQAPTTTSTTQRSDPTTTVHRPDPPTTTSSRTTSSTHSDPPKSTPTQSSSSGGTSSTIQAFLAGHNTIRSDHGAKDLTWSDDLAASAQAWANKCVFKHSTAGENLAAGVGGGYDIPAAIKSWTDEVKSYDPSNPQPSHFTQVVWRASTQVGCATQMCNGIFDDSFGKALYVVCHYSTAGNVDGQYSQNVQV